MNKFDGLIDPASIFNPSSNLNVLVSPKRKGQYNTSTPLMNPLCQNVNDSSYIK
jgi:hypothetical protein